MGREIPGSRFRVIKTRQPLSSPLLWIATPVAANGCALPRHEQGGTGAALDSYSLRATVLFIVGAEPSLYISLSAPSELFRWRDVLGSPSVLAGGPRRDGPRSDFRRHAHRIVCQRGVAASFEVGVVNPALRDSVGKRVCTSRSPETHIREQWQLACFDRHAATILGVEEA